MAFPDYNAEFTFTLVPTPEVTKMMDDLFKIAQQSAMSYEDVAKIADLAQTLNERTAPTMSASSVWTEVTDPSPLKAGDHIKVTHGDSLLEVTLEEDVEGPDWDDEYEIHAAGLPNTNLYVPAEGSKFFIKEAQFAPLGRALEPGEVVEDRTGNQYAVNPFDSSRLIDQYAGYNNHRTPALNYLHNTDVRPVR